VLHINRNVNVIHGKSLEGDGDWCVVMELSEYTALGAVNEGTMWWRGLQLTATGMAVMTSSR